MAPREVLRETQKQEEVVPEWGFRLAKVEVPTATETREGAGLEHGRDPVSREEGS